jgi:hypothetical protein
MIQQPIITIPPRPVPLVLPPAPPINFTPPEQPFDINDIGSLLPNCQNLIATAFGYDSFADVMTYGNDILRIIDIRNPSQAGEGINAAGRSPLTHQQVWQATQDSLGGIEPIAAAVGVLHNNNIIGIGSQGLNRDIPYEFDYRGSNTIILGPTFYAMNNINRGITLGHELLHIAFSMNDVSLARHLNLDLSRYQGTDQLKASQAIQDFVANGCPPSK